MESDRTRESVHETVASYAGRKGVLLVALQDVQDRFGYIPPEALPLVEQVLGAPQGEAAAVVSFYRELRTTPPTRRQVRVCDGDACAALGSRLLSRTLEEHARAHPVHFGHDTIYCLGNCALSPSIAIDGEVYGRVTPESLLRRLEELARD